MRRVLVPESANPISLIWAFFFTWLSRWEDSSEQLILEYKEKLIPEYKHSGCSGKISYQIN